MTRERPQTLRAWLQAEPFTLAMSSGFFGFFAHCGMLAALEAEGLRPRRLVGSSAGGLVAGCWAAGLDAAELETELLALRREDFWDPRPGPGLLRGRRYADKLRELLPVRRFSSCRAELAVSVFDVLSRGTRVIDEGDLVTGLRATTALPLLFHPVWRAGRPLLDGGVLDRPGHAPLRQGERVLFHHLASRSPWRRRGSPALEIPRRGGMTTLVIEPLPRVNPFALDRGHEAMRAARTATLRALDAPVIDGVVREETPL